MTAEHRWQEDAACRNSDTNMFFPDKGDPATLRAARAVCQTCAVAAECLALSLSFDHLPGGVWGGLTELERRRIRRNGRPELLAPSARAKCGTIAGHNSHRYYGEAPCAGCSQAATDYKRGRRQEGLSA